LTKNGKVCESVLTVASGLVSASAPSCSASGGGGGGAVYAVGDVGPGGGVVFYVHSSGTFASPGSDCNTNCKYLEVAPSGGEAILTWATGANQTSAVPAGATAAVIGSGMANTNAIEAQAGNVAASSAAVYAYEYSNNGKSDWHLPSKDELNELYGKRIAVGGFATADYWSSSEDFAYSAWYQNFAFGGQFSDIKSYNFRVRPVRAF